MSKVSKALDGSRFDMINNPSSTNISVLEMTIRQKLCIMGQYNTCNVCTFKKAKWYLYCAFTMKAPGIVFSF